MKKKWVDPDDAPEFTGDELLRPDVKWRIGGKEVSPEEGKAAFREALHGKSRVNTHIDNDLIAYYKAKAGSRGYQTLINSALRRDKEGDDLKEHLMKVLDERFAQIVALLSVSQPTITGAFISGSHNWAELSGLGIATTNADSAAPFAKVQLPN
jgi:uncharacterized protein (DUF4415 family)